MNADYFRIPDSVIRNSEAGGSADIGPPWRDGNPQGIALRRARVYPLLLGSGPGRKSAPYLT